MSDIERTQDNIEKAREILADYDAGRPLQVNGDGWLVRFAAHVIRYAGGFCAPPGGSANQQSKTGVTQASDSLARPSSSPSPAVRDVTLREALEKVRNELGGLSIEECCGDNLAIALCTYFDDAGDVDESGWSPATCAAHTKMLNAIHEHYCAALHPSVAEGRPDRRQ